MALAFVVFGLPTHTDNLKLDRHENLPEKSQRGKERASMKF
jgi:hypothetical protein